MNQAEIFADPEQPRQIREALRARNSDGTVPHVHCEGARFHVLSWSTTGRQCSEPRCVINREASRAH